MITLLAPLGMLALAALAVPLLIHWMRRSDRQVVSFAAMRFLRERDFPRQRLRIHDRPLLLLRCLLIAGLAVLLAAPALRTSAKPGAPWIVIAPGVAADAARAAVGTPLGEWHRLAAFFPALDAPQTATKGSTVSTRPAASGSGGSVSSLLRELDARLPPDTALTLVVPAELGGLDAERLRLGHAVDWRVLPAGGASAGELAAGRDTPAARSGTEAPAPLTLAVRYDAAGAAELPVARALAAAWRAGGLAFTWDLAPREAALPAHPGWLLWLAGPEPAAVDEWAGAGGRVLVSRQPNAIGEIVWVAGDDGDAGGGGSAGGGGAALRERSLGAGRVLSFAAALNPVDTPALSQPEFPQILRRQFEAPVAAPDRAYADDVAPLRGAGAGRGPSMPLDPYVAVCVAMLFLCERLHATRARPP